MSVFEPHVVGDLAFEGVDRDRLACAAGAIEACTARLAVAFTDPHDDAVAVVGRLGRNDDDALVYGAEQRDPLVLHEQAPSTFDSAHRRAPERRKGKGEASLAEIGRRVGPVPPAQQRDPHVDAASPWTADAAAVDVK